MAATLIKPKKKSKLERDIQAGILNVFRRVSWLHVERNNSGKMPNPRGRYVTYGLGKGSADLLCVVGPPEAGGRLLALEVKQPGKRASADQQEWLDEMKRFGAKAVVVTNLNEACAAAIDVYDRGLMLVALSNLRDSELAEHHHKEMLTAAKAELEKAIEEAGARQSERTHRRRHLVVEQESEPTATLEAGDDEVSEDPDDDDPAPAQSTALAVSEGPMFPEVTDNKERLKLVQAGKMPAFQVVGSKSLCRNCGRTIMNSPVRINSFCSVRCHQRHPVDAVERMGDAELASLCGGFRGSRKEMEETAIRVLMESKENVLNVNAPHQLPWHILTRHGADTVAFYDASRLEPEGPAPAGRVLGEQRDVALERGVPLAPRLGWRPEPKKIQAAAPSDPARASESDK